MLEVLRQGDIMKKEQQPAIIYTRVSSGAQVDDNTSSGKKGLKIQQNKCITYCKDNNLEVIATSEDAGKSAFHAKHLEVGVGKLGDLVHELRDPNSAFPDVVNIVTYSIDRVSRSGMYAVLDLIKSLVENDHREVNVHLVSEGKVITRKEASNEMDLLILVLLSMRSHNESITKSKRTSDNHFNRIALAQKQQATGELLVNVKWPNSPKWCTFDDKTGTYLLNDKATTLKRIFSEYASGSGMKTIAKGLQDDKKPTFRGGKQWTSTVISQALSSRAVLGEHLMKEGTVLKRCWVAPITEEQFNKVQVIRSNKHNTGKVGKREDSAPNIFSGILFCGCCNGTMFARRAGKPPVNSKKKFSSNWRCICNAKNLNKSCDSPDMYYQVLESIFINHVLPYVDTHNLLKPEVTDTIEIQINALELDINTKKQLNADITERMMNGERLPQMLINESMSLEDKINAIQEQINVLNTKRTPVDVELSIDLTDLEQRIKLRALLPNIIDKVVVSTKWNDNDKVNTFIHGCSAAINFKFKRGFEVVVALESRTDDKIIFVGNPESKYLFDTSKPLTYGSNVADWLATRRQEAFS